MKGLLQILLPCGRSFFYFRRLALLFIPLDIFRRAACGRPLSLFRATCGGPLRAGSSRLREGREADLSCAACERPVWAVLAEPAFAATANASATRAVTLGSKPPCGGAEKIPNQRLYECRLPLLMHSWTADSVDGRFPPFVPEVLLAAARTKRPQRTAERSARPTSGFGKT